jgi:uncharacterized protein (DUF427 family)
VVEGTRNPNAAWTYATSSEAAAEITEYVAFWHGVDVLEAAAA